jgi:hypothetical protein
MTSSSSSDNLGSTFLGGSRGGGRRRRRSTGGGAPVAGGGSAGNGQASGQRCAMGSEERENLISVMKRAMPSMGYRLGQKNLMNSHRQDLYRVSVVVCVG